MNRQLTSSSERDRPTSDRTAIEGELDSFPAEDKIQIFGIRCYGYTGYLPEEQVLGQWFEVDLELWTDLRLPGKTDELGDTIDYLPAVEAVKQLVATKKFKLVEALAEAIAALMLGQTQARRVRVKLTKCNPPIPDFCGHISISITRP